jgi:hypothetical protein
MKPIIFCDVNHGSKLEKFMSKNLKALKELGYNQFVLQSDGKSVKEAVKELETSLEMFNILNINSKDMLAMKDDFKAILEVIRLASKIGIEVLPTQGQDIESTVSKLSQEDSGVFAYLRTNLCHRFKDKDMDKKALLVFSKEDFVNSEKLNGAGSTKAPFTNGLLIENFDSVEEMMGNINHSEDL